VEVDMADSGPAALALLEARHAAGERYDVVFLDWQMPGMDGWETAARIRADGLAADAPLVVMVTAHGREKLEERSSTDQALLDGFLVKPVTASMLVDAISDARHGRDQPHLSALRRPTAQAGAPRLAGLRLLVTEDNLNNQQVARELLEGEGALVQIANNGQEGVEVAAADPPFDVVLMDLQMPVMDGFTATRASARPGPHRTAQVAMTANAMASDH
jgi:CheY-like chemotaxis protein